MKRILIVSIVLILLSSCSFIETNDSDDIKQEQEINYYLEEFDNKFYYNQLSDLSKKYYYLIYDTSLKYENSFQYSFEYSDQDFSDALDAFTHDWPLYYWWSNGVETAYSDGMYVTTSRNFDQQSVIDNCNKIQATCNDILENCINDYMVDTLKNIHDSLIELIEYDNTADNAHNIVGALIDNKCACDGYADSFQYLANLAGFNCTSVVGNAINSEGINTHAWNIVLIDDNWYGIDVTWDDPVYMEDSLIDLSYEYFLTSDEIINIDHYPEPKYNYPKCDDDSLYYYNDSGMFSIDGDRQEIIDFLSLWLNRGKDIFNIKFKNSADATNTAEWLIDKEGFADIFVDSYNSEQSFSYGYQYVATSQMMYLYYSY